MGEARDFLFSSIIDADPMVATLIERLGDRAEQTAELLAMERLGAYRDITYFFENADGREDTSALTVVLVGPMRSAKTLVGITVGEHFEELGWSVMYAKSLIDTRDNTMHSNNGLSTTSCVRFENEEDGVLLDPDLLIIDEVQFINDLPKLERILTQREATGRRTILCMLDQDFKRENWSQYLWAVAHIQENDGLLFNFGAICEECGARATRTQREIADNGAGFRPASIKDPAVLVEGVGKEKYSARCTGCHCVREDVVDL